MSSIVNVTFNSDAGVLSEKIAIGTNSGQNNQNSYAISIGAYAGQNNQNSYAISIGKSAGTNSQGLNSISIGKSAGTNNQKQNSISIGYKSGYNTQGEQSIAIGNNAGTNSQGNKAIAIGLNSGFTNQGSNSIAIGAYSGVQDQSSNSIILNASGATLNANNSGFFVSPVSFNRNYSNILCYNTTTKEIFYSNPAVINVNINNDIPGSNYGDYLSWDGNSWVVKGGNTVSIGLNAGQYNNGGNTIALGNLAGTNNQGNNSIAIGKNAGTNNQNVETISIGFEAGTNAQGEKSIAIGYQAGYINQGNQSIAIGKNAGFDNQGNNSIAIGYKAGVNNQSSNSIVLNASGTTLDTINDGFFVNPIRNNETNNNILCYDTGSKEIFYSNISNFPLNYSGVIYGNYFFWNETEWIIKDNYNVSLGKNAGKNISPIDGFPGSYTTIIGSYAAENNINKYEIAIGYKAKSNCTFFGNNTNVFQFGQCVAIGKYAGHNNAIRGSLTIGCNAGRNGTINSSIAIGHNACYNNLTDTQSCISIGYNSGYSNKKSPGAGVSIGSNSGKFSQGQFCVAIGYNAGVNNQPQNSVIINATGQVLDAINSGLFVAPIRETNNSELSNLLCYDTNTKEIKYNSAKTFVIDHPTDENKYLVHACLEGPEAGVYYRGKGEITNGSSVVIDLPDYVSSFSTDLNVQLTPFYDGKIKTFETTIVENNKFTVYGENGSFDWVVFGKRHSIEVEPLKSEVDVKGSGPYKWI